MFEELENRIGYEFKNKELLKTALTHSSYANEKSPAIECNERLEFLGDSVLGVITAEFFYKKYDKFQEGQMTKKRAACACEKSLCCFAKEINLGKHLFLGKGEEITGGRGRASILADAFEALIAAIYLDGGLDKARDFVLVFIRNFTDKHIDIVDYKTMLQEIIQKNPLEHLSYVLVAESGPDHDKRFEVEVSINSNVIACGCGRSKKIAEQEAAKQALALMGIKP